MVQFRVKVIGSGTEEDPFRVELPSYEMVPGTEEFSDPEGKVLAFVEVIVPADEVSGGRLSKKKIREKYRGQKKWDRDDLVLPDRQ